MVDNKNVGKTIINHPPNHKPFPDGLFMVLFYPQYILILSIKKDPIAHPIHVQWLQWRSTSLQLATVVLLNLDQWWDVHIYKMSWVGE